MLKGKNKLFMMAYARNNDSISVTNYTKNMESKDKLQLFLGLFLAVFADIGANFAYGLGSIVYFVRFLGIAIFLYGLFGYSRKFAQISFCAELGRNFMRILAVAALVFFVVVGILIALDKKDDIIPDSAQHLIVLGAGLYGESPSLILESRLIRAKDYLQNHPESIAILSGGQGPGESISEAEAMRRYLTQNGIANERLWLEDRSTSTSENIAFSRIILEEKLGLGKDQLLEIIIVSSDFHLYRAKLLAQRNNMIGYSISCPTPNIKLLPEYYHFRECASVFFAYLGR